MKYIGIRGHRGAGKTTIAYLLGQTIDHIIINKDIPSQDIFNNWCDEIINDEKIINKVALHNIYFDSFSDALKVFVGLLLGISQEMISDDYYKDHIVINLRDFSSKFYKEIPEDLSLNNADELYVYMPKESNPISLTKNYFITLREFILYFGYEVMQRYFGANVWVKSLKANSPMFENIFNDESSYKIYSDLKTPAEATFIKDKGGKIIKVIRPGHKKKGCGLDKLSQDDRFDFTIEIGKDLYSLHDIIIEISKNIIENYE